MERAGLPFLAARLRRRKGLALGLVFFLVALFTLSSFCWLVDVTGNTRVPEDRIKEVARQAGLYPGVPRWRCDPGRVEQALYEKVPGLAWVGVELRGTRAHIKVVEKKLPAADNTGPAAPPYARYRAQTRTTRLPGWRNLTLPVEVIATEYAEIRPYRVLRSREEAVRLARATAWQKLARRLPAAARILEQRVEVLPPARNRQELRVRVVVETLEDIGVQIPLKNTG